MKSTTPQRALAAAAVLLGAAGVGLPVLAQTSSPAKHAPTDFVRGAASSKAKRVTPPRTEQEALAKKRYVAHGIVELQLPEDRMVNLVAVRHADGTVTYEHQADGEPSPQAAAQGEVK